jgi:hypothetical protein
MPDTFVQTGVQAGHSYTVPSPGVITSWRFEHDNVVVPGLKLKVARSADALVNGSTQVGLRIVAESVAGPQTPNEIDAYPVRISVQQGDEIGMYAGGGGCGSSTSSTPDTYAVNSSDVPPSNQGTAFDKKTGGKFPVEATLEADIDLDGFGDETQDGCPGVSGPVNGCPPGAPPTKDVVAPSVFSFGFSNSTLRAASKGGSIARKKPPVGTRVRYRLSEAATARFTVERWATGRRKGHRCVAPTNKNRKAKRCSRYRRLKGSFSRLSQVGLNSFRFTGRLGGKKLRPGRYRLVMVATDAAKNRSNPKRASFRIVLH